MSKLEEKAADIDTLVGMALIKDTNGTGRLFATREKLERARKTKKRGKGKSRAQEQEVIDVDAQDPYPLDPPPSPLRPDEFSPAPPSHVPPSPLPPASAPVPSQTSPRRSSMRPPLPSLASKRMREESPEDVDDIPNNAGPSKRHRTAGHVAEINNAGVLSSVLITRLVKLIYISSSCHGDYHCHCHCHCHGP